MRLTNPLSNTLAKIIMLSCFLVAGSVVANTSVQTIALFNGRAMFSIDGQRAKIINAGVTYKGVKLIESDTSRAIIEVNGKQQTVSLNSTIVLSKSLGSKPAVSDKQSIKIWQGRNGFFQSDGEINGQSLEFIVDTGANLVVLSSRQADQIQLEYKNGQRSRASTASGEAPMYLIELDEINFGGIKLTNILAGVIVGAYPTTPLLGMSFLENVDMNRTGDVMELKKRF